MHPVTGTITLDGRPLGGVVVSFQPASGPGVLGMADESGRYELSTPGRGRDAVAGTHSVWIEVPVEADAASSVEGVLVTRMPIADVPARYVDPSTSGLGTTVRVGRTVVDLVLVSAQAVSRREAP